MLSTSVYKLIFNFKIGISNVNSLTILISTYCISRWVASHYEMMQKILTKWNLLIGGIDHIIREEDQKNTEAAKNTKETAEELLDFLKDRNALATMHFNNDIQERFKFESMVYQERLSSIIGQVDREYALESTLNLVIKANRGQTFKTFLQRAIHKPCYQLLTKVRCLVL